MESEKIVKQAFNVKWCLENSVLPVYSESEKVVIVALSDEKHINILGNFINKRIKEYLGLETKYEIRPRKYILDKLSGINDKTNVKEAKPNSAPIDAKTIEIRSSELMEGPLFTKDEPDKIFQLPLGQKKARLRRQFSERINKPPYSTMNLKARYKYCQKQIEIINKNKANILGRYSIMIATVMAAFVFISLSSGREGLTLAILIASMIAISLSDLIWSRFFQLISPLSHYTKKL